MSDDILITVADFSGARVCPRAKYWFRKHGLSWESFKSDGILLSTMRATGDITDIIDRIEVVARQRLAGNLRNG